MKESDNRKYGVILSYITIILSILIQILYTPFLVRNLGQSEYGLYSLINSMIGYLTILDLGFGNAIVVFTSKFRSEKRYEEEKKLHGMFYIIFLLISFVVGIIGIILFFNINNLFGATMNNLELNKSKILMLILTFNLVISFAFNIYSSIINAYEKFVYQKIISFFNTILKPLIMIPFLFLGYKSIAMVLITTILNMIVLLSNYIYCVRKLKIKIRFSGFDKNIFRVIFGYSIWIFIGTIVDKINWSIDQIILGSVAGTVAISLYSAASQINTLFINLSTVVNNVLLPKISKMIANNSSNEQINKEFIKIGRIQYIIIFFLASSLALFGKKFFVIWLGKDYQISYYIALILVIPLCIPLIQNIGISIMQAKNLHKFRSILYACIAIVNLVISIPLAKLYGGIGSAIGTGLSLIIGNGIIINIYYHKVVGLNIIEFWKEILKMTITFILPLLLIIMFMKIIQISSYYSIILYGSIYTIFYLLTCWYLTANQYEKNLVKQLLVKLFKKRKNYE